MTRLDFALIALVCLVILGIALCARAGEPLYNFDVPLHGCLEKATLIDGRGAMNWLERKILKEETMSFLKKYWPTIMSVAGGAVTFLLPSIQIYAAAHPKTVVGVLLGAVIAAYHSNAPQQK